MNDIDYALRYATELDENYIFSTWRKSLKAKVKSYRNYMPWAMYNEFFTRLSRSRLLEGFRILIACNSDDLEQIYGFCVYRPQEPPIIEYVYVKSIYQNLGIGKALLARAGVKNRKVLASTITDEIRQNEYNIVYLPNPEQYYV